jgi:hypothetical protein
VIENMSGGPPTAGLGEPVFTGGFPGRRLPRSLAAWALLVSTLAVAVMAGEPSKLRDTTWNDTYRYIITIERDLGHSDAQAQAIALDYYCTDLARTTTAAADRAGARANCRNYWAAQGGLAPNNPRYNQIFQARPGYPLLAAPFVAAFGLGAGLAMLSALLTLAMGWGVVLLIRLAGGGPLAALAGMIACYTLPTWFWLQQFLTEAPALVLTIAVLIGAILVLRGRTRLGLAVSAAAYVCGFAVRYSTFSALAGSLVLMIGLLVWRTPERRNRRTAVLAGFSALAFVVLTVIPPLLNWPGFKASIEELLTTHYTTPTPDNLYGKWLSLNKRYWIATADNYALQPLMPALVLLGAFLLWRYQRELAALVTAAALTGLASAAVHPQTGQLDRLYLQVYLLAVCGLPMLADLARRRGSQPPRSAESSKRPQAGVFEHLT